MKELTFSNPLSLPETDQYGRFMVSPSRMRQLVRSRVNLDYSKFAIQNSPDLEQYNSVIDQQFSTLDKFMMLDELDCTVKEFDEANQANWHMPDEYKQIDIAEYLLLKCDSQPALQRTGEELLVFQQAGLFDLLRYLRYLIDVFKENNVVWGVGRGSSVASYCLYLLEVHDVDPLYYDLDFKEFLDLGEE